MKLTYELWEVLNDITRTYDVEFRLHYDNERKESIITIGDKEGNKNYHVSFTDTDLLTQHVQVLAALNNIKHKLAKVEA